MKNSLRKGVLTDAQVQERVDHAIQSLKDGNSVSVSTRFLQNGRFREAAKKSLELQSLIERYHQRGRRAWVKDAT